MKKHPWKASLIAAMMVLSGCSLEPVYRRPDAPVAPAYPSGTAYEAPAVTNTPAAADIGWRDFLSDPRLQRLVEIALANNRDLRVAALNVEEARAQWRIQRAAQLPQVGLQAAGSASHTPASLSASGQATTKHEYTLGASASWEIDFFGRVQSLKDQALQEYLASAQARKAFEIVLVSQVADEYLTLLSCDDLLAVTQHTLDTAQAAYKLTEQQFQAGTTTELAVRQSQSVVEQANANHSAQLRARAQAQNALVLLIGQPLPADLPPGRPLQEQSIVSDIPAGLPSELLTRRPDVMEAEAQLRAANASIGAARAAFFPSVSLTGVLGTASVALGGLLHGGGSIWSFQPSITQPIFKGGALQADLDVAKLEKDVRIAQYEKAIQLAFSEVADGLAARGTYEEEVTSLERLVQSQQRALDIAQAQFATGVADYLAVLTAQNGLYAAQLSLVSLRLDRLTNLVDLYRYLGGGWIEHTGDAPRVADAVDASGPGTPPRPR